MKITFPIMGDSYIFGRLFFQEIGIKIISPSLNTVKGLEKGSLHSPDEICLPFKLMISNLIESYEMGADTVIMPATMGPCRLGEYAELFKSILDKKGYYFNWILLDSTQAIGKKELLKRLNSIVRDNDENKIRIIAAMMATYGVIKKLEALEAEARISCGYEANKGTSKKIIKECKRELERASSLKNARIIIDKYNRKIKNILLNKESKPLKLLLTGEIYSLIDPFANHHIEETLMDMGVCFEKKISIGWWIRHTLINPLSIRSFLQKRNGYLAYEIGGYAKETVSESHISYQKDYDGIIQIFPVGCMPEIVAKAALTSMSKDLNIKVLTVIFDEMAGEAGYITRIEAFVDMLQRKKKAEKKAISKGGGMKNALYGN